MPRFPAFFLVGPPRTGTTWLYEVLRHSLSLPFPAKETRFFDTHFDRGIDWYLRHFPDRAGARVMGEVAPTYFASSVARERIAGLRPAAKIVCTFRNPVERILSLYKVKRAYGMSPWSFEEAVVNDPELVSSGRYATHLRAWQSAFGEERVLATVYEDLRRDPQAYVNTITDFIAAPRISLALSQRSRVHDSDELTHPRSYFLTRFACTLAEWFKAERMDRLLVVARRRVLLRLLLGSGREFEALSADVVDRLYELFLPEVEELESILKRDLSAWKPRRLRSRVELAV
ncbi:MAG: sulfotransferase domain-containing protein [Acidobacteria bacterium]|nr:sulfotransferase domain-containing protein [Acidobacteriota bacterium]